MTALSTERAFPEPVPARINLVFQVSGSLEQIGYLAACSFIEHNRQGVTVPKLPAEIKARVSKAADILEITPFLDRKPRQLSGGQRQRVAMGRAIVRQPQVFLFDEPLSNLDAKLRAQTRLEIQKLHRELGITSLFVTHDQVEAMTLAQRMIVMNAGVMEQFGTPEEVYNRPATTFVASFIGSPAMNLLKAAPDAPHGTIVGVRPEHLDITDNGWALRVDAIELLGAERLIYGRWLHGAADEMVTIRTEESAAQPAVGSTIHVTARPGKVHYFDAATGQRRELTA